MDLEEKKFRQNIEKYANMKEFCNVTLVSEDSEKIRAHKVVMASVGTGSWTCSRLMTRIYNMN